MVILRDGNGAGGKAWVGVVQLLAECTECFGLPMPFGDHYATRFSYAAHISGYIELK